MKKRPWWFVSPEEHRTSVAGAIVFLPLGAYVYAQGGWRAIWGSLGAMVAIWIIRSFMDGWRSSTEKPNG